MVESLLAHGAGRIYATARHDSDFDAIVALDRHRVIALELDVTDAAARRPLENGPQRHRASIRGHVKWTHMSAQLITIGRLRIDETEALKRYADGVIPLIEAAGGQVVSRGPHSERDEGRMSS